LGHPIGTPNGYSLFSVGTEQNAKGCRVIDFSFKPIVVTDKGFTKALFKEFLQTKRQPSFHLYLLQHFKESELDDIINEKNNRAPTVDKNR